VSPAPLVCRALWGLTDAMNGVYRCAKYAASSTGHGRPVLVTFPIFDASDASSVLEVNPESPPPVPVSFLSRNAVEALVHSTEKREPLEPLTPRWNHERYAFDPSCSLQRAYPRDTLMTVTLDGTQHSAHASLRWFRLTERSAARFSTIRAALPPTYGALHARDTDHKSDADAVRASIRELLQRHASVVLFTDSVVLQQRCREEFPSVLLSPIPLQGKGRLPQHETWGRRIPTLLEDAIFDLFLAANAAEVLVTQSRSEFSRTIQILQREPGAVAAFTRGANTTTRALPLALPPPLPLPPPPQSQPLVCRAIGGLNDCLNQLSHAIHFGTRRTVVVEFVEYSATPLADVFECVPQSLLRMRTTCRASEIVLGSPATTAALIAAAPRVVPSDGTLDPQRVPDAPKLTMHGVDWVPSCSLEKEYPPDTLLVRNSGGGGDSAMNALRHLRLTPFAATEFQAARAALPQEYAALHARHTDLRTSEKHVISLLTGLLARHKHVVLFTDSNALHAVVTAALPHVLRSPASTLFPDGSGGQHTLHGRSVPGVLLDAVLDLCLCADATEIAASVVGSGFSRLAQVLARNRHERLRFTRRSEA
jgi:hypothetical protein